MIAKAAGPLVAFAIGARALMHGDYPLAALGCGAAILAALLLIACEIERLRAAIVEDGKRRLRQQ